PVPSLAHLAPAAADVPRIKLHGRATKSRACDAIRRTPDAGARTCALPEPPPPTAPSVAPLRSVAADVSRLKLHSRPAKKRPFEEIGRAPCGTRGIWELDEPPPSTVPAVAPLRPLAADVGRLNAHWRRAKRR